MILSEEQLRSHLSTVGWLLFVDRTHHPDSTFGTVLLICGEYPAACQHKKPANRKPDMESAVILVGSNDMNLNGEVAGAILRFGPQEAASKTAAPRTLQIVES